MNQSQEEIRRIIISDMVKKMNSIVPALLWVSYGPLKWIRSAFEEGSKVLERFKTVMGISDRRVVVNNFALPRIGIQKII